MTVRPLRESEIGAIERAIGGSRKEREAVALIRLMRDVPACGPVAASRLTWADVAALPGGEGAVDLGDSRWRPRWWVSPATLAALEPLRGFPAEPVFRGRAGRPLGSSSLSSRIASICRAAGLGEGFGTESPRAGTQADARAAGWDAPPRYHRGIVRPSGETGGGSVRFHPSIARLYARRAQAGDDPIAADAPPAALAYRSGPEIVAVRCGPPVRSEVVEIGEGARIRAAAGRLAGVEVIGIWNRLLARGAPRHALVLAHREWGHDDADLDFAEREWPATARLANEIVERALHLHRKLTALARGAEEEKKQS